MTEPLVAGRCAKRVYGHRGTHQCTRAAAYPVEAPLFCKQHDTQAIAKIEAKNKRQEEDHRAYWNRQLAIERMSKDVVDAAMAWHAGDGSLDDLVVALKRLVEAKA